MGDSSGIGRVVIDGTQMQTIQDFHQTMASMLDFGPYYGGNIAALRDRLTTDVPRPVFIIWKNSEFSRRLLRNDFQKILDVFEEAKQQGLAWGHADIFDYELV